MPEAAYLLIVYPRYSPDGALDRVRRRRRHVPGLSGPAGAAGVSAGPPPASGAPGGPSAPKLLPGSRGTDPTSPRSVAAHGFPAEPYVVSPSGADARRLAQLPIDDAAVAWSPDNAWVAVSGASGVFLVNVADGEMRRINENGSFGAIDWR